MGFNYKKDFHIKSKLALIETFVENLGANVFVANRDGDIIFANQKSADTYQCTLDELFDFNAFTMQEKGYTDRQPAVKEVLLNKKEIKRYIKTGKDVGMIISCKPVFGEDGEVDYAVATSYREEDFLYLLNQVDKQKQKLQETVAYLNKLGQKPFFIASANEKMKQMYELAQKSASMDSAVMIYGASGTGKEVLANYIHSISHRKDEPFIPVNCAAIPKEMMESEFFGYVWGFSKPPPTALCFWMKSGNSRCRCSRSSCACWNPANTNASAPIRFQQPMLASSAPRTKTCGN